jgi:hypothetical protein
MVSPLMELKPENLSGKAFRFGIFWNRIPAAPTGVIAFVWQRKFAGSAPAPGAKADTGASTVL